MEMDSRSGGAGKGSLEELMRERIRATIEAIVDEELEAALGAERSARVGSVRAGYRHGKRPRTLSTSLGATTIAMPRARLESANGENREWRSQMIPRYQRRTERVDEAILGIYLSGTNTRRLRGALSPLLRGAPLSKDAVSRLVGRLREDFEAWAKRDLSELKVRYIFLDGWYPRCGSGRSACACPYWSRWGCVPMANAWSWTCGYQGSRANRLGWTRSERWPGATWVRRSWR
jgi:putative transposase